MTLPNLDELDRVRFVWPEPLVIELIRDQYAGRVPGAQTLALAKLHEHMLRGMVETGRDDRSARCRQLLAQCGDCGLDAEAVARIDQAVVFELIRLVGMRFRNSPRLRAAYDERLQAALAPITAAVQTEVRRPARPALVPKVLPPSRWRNQAAVAA